MARLKMKPHQHRAVDYCMGRDHAALFLDMRLRKTPIVITTCIRRNTSRILVAAPYEAFNGWMYHLQRYRQSYVLLEGTPGKREKLLASDVRWFLLNKEGYKVIPRIKYIPWGATVIDESTFLKDPRTDMSKFYVKNFRKVPYRFILSGTPAPEDILDYFQQLQFLDRSILGCNNFYEFRNKYFKKSFHKYTLTEKGEQFIKERLAEHCFILERKDIGLKSGKKHRTIYVRQTPKFNNMLKVLNKEMLLEIDDKEIRSTTYAPVNFDFMHQLTGGFAGEEFIYKSKLRALKELLVNLGKRPVVIWAAYVNELLMLAEQIPDSRLIYGKVKPKNRRIIQQGFQQGEFNRLIANPACFKFGVDLSRAYAEAYYSRPYSLLTNLQSEERVIDIDIKESKYVYDLLVIKSIDIDIYNAKRYKENFQQMWKRIIKRCQKEVFDGRQKSVLRTGGG